MNLKGIVKKGYFPKELPPPFTSSILADKLKKILTASTSYSTLPPHSSKAVKYTIPKGKISRRKLEIPHPKQFIGLCENIVSNWSSYSAVYSLSTFSESSTVEKRKSNRAISTKSKSLNEFRLNLIKGAYNKSYELKFDIAQFYPTIYTHSITWAIMGINDAKHYFKQSGRKTWATLLTTDPKARLYEFANKLDIQVRSCQERQSIGIPIGPDTSFILAEFLASRIDSEIKSVVGNQAKCSRYYDDYYFYLDSRAEAERILKQCQKIINDYKLELNESKVSISEAPFVFEYEWANIISAFRFKKVDQFEIRSFFDTVFRTISQFPDESSQIVRYALQRFEFGNVPIKKIDWQTFLLLILHLQSINPSNLDQVLRILLSYRAYWDKNSLYSIKMSLESIIERHVQLNHSFEVSWALWSMISLNIKCSSNLLSKVLDSQDYISKLVCLDMINRKLFVGRMPKTYNIFKSFLQEDLYGDSWLFTYESIYKGWLARAKNSFLDSDPFIKILRTSKVEFYLPSNQVDTEFIYDPESKNPIIRKEVLTKKQKLELAIAASFSSKY